MKTVAELVSTAPGVAVNQYGGLGQLATVSIRGSTADQVQVFLDGLPLNPGAGGGVDLSRIPRTWIERVEVVRGAEGARYGTGTLGGVLNIVTHPAASGAWAAEATAGSFDTFALSADGATGGERWGALGAAVRRRRGGEEREAEARAGTAAGSSHEVLRVSFGRENQRPRTMRGPARREVSWLPGGGELRRGACHLPAARIARQW